MRYCTIRHKARTNIMPTISRERWSISTKRRANWELRLSLQDPLLLLTPQATSDSTGGRRDNAAGRRYPRGASGVGGAGRAVFLSGQGNGWRRHRGTGEAARGFVFRQAGPSLPTRTEEGEGRRRAPPSLARPSSSGRPPAEREGTRGEPRRSESHRGRRRRPMRGGCAATTETRRGRKA